MSELQTENGSAPTELITPEVAPTDTGTTTGGAELATDTVAEQEKTTEIDAHQKTIKRMTQQKHQERRRAEASDAHAAELQAKLDAIEAAKPVPTVSNIPEREYMTDAEFDAAMVTRDQEVANVAAHNARKQDRQDAQNLAQQNAETERVAKGQRSLEGYRTKVTGAGFDPAVMAAAENAVVNYGIKTDQIEYIVSIDDGSIMQHLAQNPDDMDTLRSMDAFTASNFINSTLTEKAKVFKHKPSTAPPPLETLSGNGVDPDMNKNPWLKGVTIT